MTTEKPLKIVSLVSENIKKIVAIRIDPRGNLVQITGKNGSGKTSTLDSIWWALAGASNVQKSPIRNGQEKARIRLDMGELIATRTFTRTDDGSFTTTIAVETAEGARFSKPQAVLDALLDSLAFDPLEFARMKPKAQFDTLKGMVPGVDFAKLEGLNRADFDKRTAVNREAKAKTALAESIAIPATTPPARVDETAIVEEIGAVGAFNAELERRKERRMQADADAKAKREGAEARRHEAFKLNEEAERLDEEAAAIEKKLAEAPPLDEPKDAAAIRAKLEEAKRTNLAVEQALRRATLLAEVTDLEAEAEKLTAAIAEREQAKREAIGAAKLPVDGIEFAEDSILLNGVPFDQASDAEQLRASVAIAMASNPRLRVIRVRDGSLLDEDGLRLVAEMAGARDFQCWIESVDSTGKVGFVLEDGHVRSAPEAEAPAQVAAE